LTAVAPYVFSSGEYYGGRLPLIFNALGEIDSLDIIIAQSSNAVYPYPLYQSRIHLLLAKASLNNGKIFLGHVETFGRRFLEEKFSSGDLIRSQVLSESLVYGVDGISSFTFTYLLDEPTGESLAAYMDSVKEFFEIQGFIKSPPNISLFLPRRAEYWVFAQNVLQLFRKLGVDLSLVQLPLHGKNVKLSEVSLIILADPPELDGDEVAFLGKYVEDGGAILVTGYPPTGLRPVLGVDERNVGKYGGVEVIVDYLKRCSRGKILGMGYRLVYCPTLNGSEPLAILRKPKGYGGVRDIGSYAATLKEYGKGLAVFTGVPAKTLLTDLSPFFLDLVDLCLAHSGKELKWEFEGLNELVDVVVRDDLLIAFNHGDKVRFKAKYSGDFSGYEVLGKALVSVKDRVFEIELGKVEYCCIKLTS